jgi:hypothetical protein
MHSQLDFTTLQDSRQVMLKHRNLLHTYLYGFLHVVELLSSLVSYFPSPMSSSVARSFGLRRPFAPKIIAANQKTVTFADRDSKEKRSRKWHNRRNLRSFETFFAKLLSTGSNLIDCRMVTAPFIYTSFAMAVW